MADLSDNVSAEERLKISQICREYLSDVWSHSNENNLLIKRFAQGFVNKLFYCQLTQDKNGIKVSDCEPVVVKFQATEDAFLYNPLLPVINSLVLSKERLSPKVLGIFPEGIIYEFIESRSYNYLDDFNPTTVGLLATKLAKFHSLKPPIPKDDSKIWLRIFYDSYFESEVFESIKSGNLYKIIKNSNYQTLKRLNFAEEIIWMRDTMLASNPIVVYNHCDFNRGNILVKQNDKTLELFFIDLDYTSNNFRGIDIGRYFSSWRHRDPHFGFEEYPTDEEMSPFIDAYIDESNKLIENYSKSDFNTKESLIKEAKLFTLVSYLIDVIFCLWMTEMDLSKADDFLTKAETRFYGYVSMKEKFQNEKLFSFN